MSVFFGSVSRYPSQESGVLERRIVRHNPEFHARSKHIKRRHFYVRDVVEEGELVVPLIGTDDNYADFFTKPLKAKAFFALRDKIMNVAA